MIVFYPMNRVNNPYEILNQHYSSYDMVVARSSFPEEAAEIYGAAVCMGFLYIKGSFISIGILDGLVAHMYNIKRPDDQRSMNKLLTTLGLRFDKRLATGDKSVTTDFGHFEKWNSRFNLALLPHRSFPRICPTDMEEMSKVVVGHCLFLASDYLNKKDREEAGTEYVSIKKGSYKETLTKIYGLWILKPNFNVIKKTSEISVETFIRSITVPAVVDF